MTGGKQYRRALTTRLRLLTATCCAVAATGLTVVAGTGQLAHAAVPTVSQDNLRTGWDSNEPGLSPSSVSASDFGQIFTTKVDGPIYGQPVTGNGTMVVTTENASAYGIDPITGKIIWNHHLGTPFPASVIDCGDIQPTVGSTSTPVIDTTTGTVYLTTKIVTGNDPKQPTWFLHALSVQTGAERAGWPVKIGGFPDNDSNNAFNSYAQQQRPGLLLLNGVVYIGFGSSCDVQPFRGYVAGVSTTTHTVTALWADETGTGSKGAGIWQSGGGLVSDGPGQIVFSTGNGLSPAPGPGSPTPRVLAESVVRLQVGSNGKLTPIDFFSPSNAPELDHGDRDFGSGGPMAIPQGYGTAAHPRLLMMVGKDGRVYLLDGDHLGGRSQGPGGTDDVLSVSGPFKGVWGHPAFYGGDNGGPAYLYDVENQGPLRAFRLGVSASGTPQLSSAGTSANTFGYTSGSPVVTSVGTTPGSALVWVIASSGPTGAGGQLMAYDAMPVNGVMHLRWSTPIGSVTRFPVVATDGGRVYVGTLDGRVVGFGRPATSVLQTTPLDLGSTPVGISVQGVSTLTATAPVTITGISTAAPFSVNAPTLPVSLSAGDTLDVPVSYDPTGAGHDTGTLTITTNSGTFAADLLGHGTQPGLAADPSSLNFGEVQSGGDLAPVDAISITNTGTTVETITGVVAPADPFSSDQLPSVGDTIEPDASITVPITYTPQDGGGTSSSSLEIDSDQGNVVVPITGTSVSGASQLTLDTSALNFGSVPVNAPITLTFTVSNTGDLPLTITKAKAPAGVFTSPAPLAEGLSIPAADGAQVPVTFKPTKAGTFTAQYEISADDGSGEHYVTLTGVGAKRVAMPAVSGSTWRYTGGAKMTSTGLQLTDTGQQRTGGAFAIKPARLLGLTANFSVFLGGGTGGEGMAFVMADASTNTPTSLGAGGAGLGYGGLDGLAIAFDTVHQNGEPAAPVIGLVGGGASSNLLYFASAPVPKLRGAWHKVAVSVTRAASNGTVQEATVTVSLDGKRLFAAAVPGAALPLPDKVYLGFTAASSTMTDRHAVTVGSLSVLTP